MLIDVKENSASLKKLWSETFGDDDEYINLLFDFEYTPSECFAEIFDGEVISVLYLLKGYISSDKKNFEGRYLYAAATDRQHRGKGIMAKLIIEAQEYIKDKGLSFICLVPADEGLYGYYARFGFEAVMKNYVSSVSAEAKEMKEESAVIADYLKTRNYLSVPFFHFGNDEWKYALSCLDYAGFRVMKNTVDSYFIIDEDKNEVLEYISSVGNFTDNTESLLTKLSPGTTVVSPYDLSDFCECKETRFGMIYFADVCLKKYIGDGVYMNIALD